MRNIGKLLPAVALLVLGTIVQPATAQTTSTSSATSPSDTVLVAPPKGETVADRTSILAALGDVDPGGTVMFAPGTYVIGGLNLDVAVPGITLLGHPDGTTIRGCEPDVFGAYEIAMFACNALGLSGGHQTVRGLTFEYAWHGITIGCCLPTDLEQFRSGAWRPEPTRPGGDIIEGNTFRYTPNGLRVLGRSAERTVIRENQFVDVYHAIGINGGGVDFLDNRIYTDQPHRVPTSMHPGDAINISPAGGPGDHTTCSDNVVKGNRIEGYTHGIRIAVDAPDTSCRRNVIRGNTIAVQRVPFVTDWFDIGWSDEADSTVVGVPLGLINYPMIEPGPDGRPEPGRIPVIEDNVIEGNEIAGGYGLGMEVAHASRNRIVNNVIRGISVREPFPGNVLSEPVLWDAANGSGIWLSPGSDGNEIVGNVFEDIASSAVVIEGDDNRVELRSPGDAVRDLGTGNRVIVAEQERAAEAYQSALALDPDNPSNLGNLGFVYALMGRHAEAIRAAEQARGLAPQEQWPLTALGYAYARAGQRAEAAAVLRTLEALPEPDPYYRAIVYAGIGERDEVFSLLEQAGAEGNALVEGLGVDPVFAPYRGDPRMERLLERLDLPAVSR